MSAVSMRNLPDGKVQGRLIVGIVCIDPRALVQQKGGNLSMVVQGR